MITIRYHDKPPVVDNGHNEIEMHDHDGNNQAMNTPMIDDGMVAVGTGIMGMFAMGSALLLSMSERFNPILQMIGLMLGIIATCLTLVTLILNLHERWKKSTQSRRSSKHTPGSR